MITLCINREIHPPLWVCCGIREPTDICCCSFAKSCPTLCNPMDCSTTGFLVLHCLPEFAQTHVHWVDDTTQPSHLCHPLLLMPPIFQAPGSFLMSWLFTSGSQSFRTSTSASILPMYIQGWFLLGLTGLISLLSKELSRVFSSTTVWKHQFFSAQPSLWFNSHICTVFR